VCGPCTALRGGVCGWLRRCGDRLASDAMRRVWSRSRVSQTRFPPLRWLECATFRAFTFGGLLHRKRDQSNHRSTAGSSSSRKWVGCTTATPARQRSLCLQVVVLTAGRCICRLASLPSDGHFRGRKRTIRPLATASPHAIPRQCTRFPVG